MGIRVFDRQALGRGGGVELAIGGDEGDGTEALRSMPTVDGQGGRELHGIVSAQPMLPRRVIASERMGRDRSRTT